MSRHTNSYQQKKGGIKGNHQKKNGPILVYVIIFVVVSIAIITLNQTRKKRLERGITTGQTQGTSQKKSDFTKEGELEFLHGEDVITKIDIEIADDDYQTQRGLMYRRSMKEDRGMLFIFEDVQERSFWMKNTYISLDIIYIAADKTIVSIAEGTQTRSEESIPSNYPAKYVVEVNAGFAAQYQLKPGDKISFKRVFE